MRILFRHISTVRVASGISHKCEYSGSTRTSIMTTLAPHLAGYPALVCHAVDNPPSLKTLDCIGKRITLIYGTSYKDFLIRADLLAYYCPIFMDALDCQPEATEATLTGDRAIDFIRIGFWMDKGRFCSTDEGDLTAYGNSNSVSIQQWIKEGNVYPENGGRIPLDLDSILNVYFLAWKYGMSAVENAAGI
ncbi:hypothetical protein EJ02DRAFT_510969 [Clathrospora elynae]|uniref:Uncharacterized protein n=1 Tax=Clathrospora elynae TaxID=706981 RepID=A0A6A5SUT5_9PLEO|nr:hypothetical protein EJ02DRAFT_510969 [Clathrospora elynae]